MQSETGIDYGITSEDEKCERSEDEMSVPSQGMQVVSCDIDEGQDDSDGDTAGAVALRCLDTKSAAKQCCVVRIASQEQALQGPLSAAPIPRCAPQYRLTVLWRATAILQCPCYVCEGQGGPG